MDANDIKEYFNYYWSKEPRYRMIRYTQNREAAFFTYNARKDGHINNKRLLRCHNAQSFQIIFDVLKARQFRLVYNLYYSIGEYEGGIPRLEFFKDRERKANWNLSHTNHMIGYDCFIDIDAPDFDHVEDAKKDTLKICAYLDTLNCPYEVRFSGKGFHIILPHYCLPEKSFNIHETDTIYRYCRKIAEHLHSKFTEYVDLSIYDSRRVCKLPYSISVYEDRMMVAIPFTSKKELKEFDYTQSTPGKVLKAISGQYSGSRNIPKVFNQEGNIKQLEKEVFK